MHESHPYAMKNQQRARRFWVPMVLYGLRVLAEQHYEPSRPMRANHGWLSTNESEEDWEQDQCQSGSSQLQQKPNTPCRLINKLSQFYFLFHSPNIRTEKDTQTKHWLLLQGVVEQSYELSLLIIHLQSDPSTFQVPGFISAVKLAKYASTSKMKCPH